jgi:hypothetical protein
MTGRAVCEEQWGDIAREGDSRARLGENTLRGAAYKQDSQSALEHKVIVEKLRIKNSEFRRLSAFSL